MHQVLRENNKEGEVDPWHSSTFPSESPFIVCCFFLMPWCAGWNDVSSKDMSTWNLWMWLYLEKGICRCYQIKNLEMRSYWVSWVGLKHNDKCPYKKGRKTQPEVVPCRQQQRLEASGQEWSPHPLWSLPHWCNFTSKEFLKKKNVLGDR